MSNLGYNTLILLFTGSPQPLLFECALVKPRTDAIVCKPRQSVNHTRLTMCDRLAQEGVGRGIRTHDLLVTSSPTPPTWIPFRVVESNVLFMGNPQPLLFECALGKPRTDAIACKPRQPVNHTRLTMCDSLAQEGVGSGIRTHDLFVTSSPTPPTWTPLRVNTYQSNYNNF